MTFVNTLQTVNLLNETTFRQLLASTLQPPLPQSAIQFVNSRPWAEIQAALTELMAQVGSVHRSLKEEEFESLRFAAAHGAPSVPAPQVGVPPLFEVRLTDVRLFSGPTGNFTFRVVPVSRLRMVLAQTAYRRLDPVTGQAVSVAFQAGGRQWYPGTELFGEGVYIDLADESINLQGDRSQAWADSYQQSPNMDETLHPVHVWWHTFSHRLLRALSVDSGYSSASIRERVYLSLQPGQPVRGAVLLYTVQPGGDGTLGGLIGLVPSFAQVISSALRDLSSCSNDPLCEESVPDGINGSACYSCLLASETSCEQRNVHLDRGILLQNLP